MSDLVLYETQKYNDLFLSGKQKLVKKRFESGGR